MRVRIDSLTHITSDGKWYETTCDARLSSLLREMDKAELDMAVLAGISPQDDDVIFTACEQHPGRFLAAPWLDISMTPEQQDQRLENLNAHGVKAVKIHPRLSRTPIGDARARYAVTRAGAHGMACFVCTVHRPPLPSLQRPLSADIQELCECTRSPIILLHGGYTDLLVVSETIRPYEHVLLDLSMTYPRFRGSSLGRDVLWLTQTFDRRIIFGSDFPEHSYSDILKALQADGQDIADLENRGILGKNLTTLLKLKA